MKLSALSLSMSCRAAPWSQPSRGQQDYRDRLPRLIVIHDRNDARSRVAVCGPDRSGQGRQREPSVDRATDGVSDPLAAIRLREDGDLGKAAGGDDICLIGYPELVGAGGRDVGGSIRQAR
jgi:hypothetical protein